MYWVLGKGVDFVKKINFDKFVNNSFGVLEKFSSYET